VFEGRSDFFNLTLITIGLTLLGADTGEDEGSFSFLSIASGPYLLDIYSK
jgi:hypothetical protein